MRKYLAISLAAILIGMASIAWAADTKLSELDAATAVTRDDLMLITDAPGTTPASKKITVGQVVDSAILQTFTGSTIPDTQTIPQALQALETAVEGKQAFSSTLATFAALSAIPAGIVIASGSTFSVSQTLEISKVDLTSALLVLPQGTAGGYASEGYPYWKTDTDQLFIGNGSATKTVAYMDSNITGNAAGITGSSLTSYVLITPEIRGNEIVASTTQQLTASQLYGTRINNYGQATNVALTLAVGAQGMDSVFVAGTATAATFAITATGSNNLYYSGAKASSAKIVSPAIGDYFVIYSFKTGASTWDWILKNGQGTIATF